MGRPSGSNNKDFNYLHSADASLWPRASENNSIFAFLPEFSKYTDDREAPLHQDWTHTPRRSKVSWVPRLHNPKTTYQHFYHVRATGLHSSLLGPYNTQCPHSSSALQRLGSYWCVQPVRSLQSWARLHAGIHSNSWYLCGLFIWSEYSAILHTSQLWISRSKISLKLPVLLRMSPLSLLLVQFHQSSHPIYKKHITPSQNSIAIIKE